MGEAKRRKAESNLPFIMPVDAIRDEYFDDPRFAGAPMAELFSAAGALLSSGAEQSDRVYKQTIETPTGPMAVVLIYPKPVRKTPG